MKMFEFARPADAAGAVAAAAKAKTAQQGAEVRFIAGGTTLVDLMKLSVETPSQVVDINRLPLDKIEPLPGGGLKIGATVRNSDLANNATVKRDYPVLSQAILQGASAQLRNMATTAGNLLQRTRCVYFRDPAMPCNKREPGTGCSAIDGFNRMNAILGWSETCIAVHPSDLCVALAALEAIVHVSGTKGDRAIPFADFHRLPGDTPQIDTNLACDEIIIAIELPPEGFSSNYSYLKIRDRLSYAFALVSVAAALKIEGGAIKDARVALGGVAHKPWRVSDAEKRLVGQQPSRKTFGDCADILLQGATGFAHNSFKIELARRAIVRTLEQAAAGTPQIQSVKAII